MSPTPPRVRALKWVASARKDLQAMPADEQDVLCKAILTLELGHVPQGARPFGEGLPPAVWKLVDHDVDNTYRAAFTVHFTGVVYVLDVFVKKSTSGIATPRVIRDRVLARFHAAREDYERTVADAPSVSRRRTP